MPVAQGEDPVHMAGQLHVVRGDQGGDARGLGQIAQGFEHRLAGGRIQIAGRFVGQQQARTIGQGAGDGDALLFPARQLRRLVAQSLAQTQGRQG